MRNGRRWLGMGIIVLLLIAVAYGWLGAAGSRSGKLQLEAAALRISGEFLIISVLSSNAGSTVLINGGNCEVRYQIEGGAWSRNSFPGYGTSISWLVPGQTHTEQIRLPRGTSRFQVSAGYEIAHGRVATACRLYNSPLPHVISGVLANALSPLPYRPGPYVEFWDDEHDVRFSDN